MGASDKTSKPDLKDFSDILPELPIMPDEDPMDFTVFQAGLWRDLAPNTPYASVLADNVIAKEWEIYRLRRWQSSWILAQAEELLLSDLSNLLGKGPGSEFDVKALVKAAFRETEAQADALESLEELGLDVSQILARVYAGYSDAVPHFERQIATLENSRRRLYADFNAVNDRFELTADEAEVL